MPLYTGTSGFAYKEWKGPFYPEGTKDREMLSVYASRLRSVEINYTYRRQASEKTLGNWREATPETFRFTLKANQRITHWLRLRDADEAVRDFLERARVLGDRLGPILFQCPPNLEYDRSLIEAFVGYLPPGVKAAMEFRHPSWQEARPILAGQGVAWCSAETDEEEADEPSWEPFGYLRLRKTEYTDDELHKWAERISPALADGRDVYVYFKHEDGAASAKWAVRLREMLEAHDAAADIRGVAPAPQPSPTTERPTATQEPGTSSAPSAGLGARIAPWLSVRDAEKAVAFYRTAFGAEERYRLDDDGKRLVVARLSVGASEFWVQEEPDGPREASPGRVRMVLSVDDPDLVFDRSVEAGGTAIAAVHEEHGWRTGRLTDPFGHDWEISREIAEPRN